MWNIKIYHRAQRINVKSIAYYDAVYGVISFIFDMYQCRNHVDLICLDDSNYQRISSTPQIKINLARMKMVIWYAMKCNRYLGRSVSFSNTNLESRYCKYDLIWEITNLLIAVRYFFSSATCTVTYRKPHPVIEFQIYLKHLRTTLVDFLLGSFL